MGRNQTTAEQTGNFTVCSPRSAVEGFALPLSMVRVGKTVRIKTITGKDETRRFLGSIGFVQDAEVAVISEANGNVIVNVKGTRVAISRAMANRVLTA